MDQKRITLFVVAVAILLSIPWLSRPFSSRGEPREALVAQAMLRSGNWISPPAYDGSVPSKPPLTHWLISSASLMRGEVTESSARLPSAIAFIFFTACFSSFLAKRFGGERAIATSLILLTSPEWIRAAVSCRVDTVLSVSLAGSLLALFSWQGRGRVGFPVLAILLVSIATLTKGPIGCALPAVIFLLFLMSEESLNAANCARILRDGLKVLIPVLATASIWYVAAYLQRGDEFLQKFWYENIQRLAGTMEDEPHNHTAPYLWILTIVGLLPWSLLAAVELFRARKTGWWKIRALRRLWAATSDFTKFSSIATFVTIVFFSIPTSKRSVYVLPAYPFLAFLLSELFDQAARQFGESTFKVGLILRRVAVGLSVIVPLVMAGLLIFGVFSSRDSVWAAFAAYSQNALLNREVLIVFVCSVILVVLATRFIKRDLATDVSKRLEWIVGFPLIISISVINLCVLGPVFESLSPKTWLSDPMVRRALNVEREEKYYSYGSENYAASFYLRKPFLSIGSRLPYSGKVFVEERNASSLNSLAATRLQELSRFKSLFEGKNRDVTVVLLPSEQIPPADPVTNAPNR